MIVIATALAIGMLVFIVASRLAGLEMNTPQRDIYGDVLGRGPLGDYMASLDADLAEAGVDMSPFGFLARSALAGVAVWFVVASVLGLSMVGVAMAVLVGVWWMRSRYLGGPAARLREATTRYTAEAARSIAAGIAANQTASESLQSWVGQAVLRSDARGNRVSQRLADALEAAKTMRIDEAFRSQASALGNRAFSALIETYLLTSKFGDLQCALALKGLATEIETELRLRAERKTQLGQAIGSVKIMGAVIAFLVVIMMFLLQTAGGFYRSTAGQIFLIIVAAWWYFGFRIISGQSEVDD